jgi:succinate dehydrogenase / fumarate reductase iron-sulfur subunit
LSKQGQRGEEEVVLKIARQDPKVEKESHFETYRVPHEVGMVVLDAVHYIQNHLDGTLAARWNCKAARCGSCSAEIDGIPKLMCKTPAEAGHEYMLTPLKAYPLVKDLVTDVSENFEIMRKIPPFSPNENTPKPWIMFERDVERSVEFRKCIECFICQDICHVIREHRRPYIGPRFLVKVASLDLHPMDTTDRSAFLHDEGGIGYCNITKCCQELCPEHITITDNAIIPEKERLVDKRYDPIGMLIGKLRSRNKEQHDVSIDSKEINS